MSVCGKCEGSENMALENSIQLIKDFPMEPVKDGLIGVPSSLLMKNCCPVVVGESRNGIREYVQLLKEMKRQLLVFDIVPGSGADRTTVLDVHLPKPMVDEFCLILPNPFFRIRVTMNDPILKDHKTTVEKQFNLSTILWKKPNSTRIELFNVNGELEKYHAKCDISLGWMEEGPVAVVISKGVTKIKLSPSAFMKKLNLYSREDSKDLRIVAGNGKELKCHKFIFEAHGEGLAAMVSAQNGMVEGTTGAGVISMKGNSEEGLSLLIRYLYGLELVTDDMNSDVAIELLCTAHKYKLMELQDALVELLLQKKMGWFTPDNVLELHFFVKSLAEFERLKEFSISVMLSKRQEIRTCERFKELMRMAPDAANELIWQLLELK